MGLYVVSVGDKEASKTVCLGSYTSQSEFIAFLYFRRKREAASAGKLPTKPIQRKDRK